MIGADHPVLAEIADERELRELPQEPGTGQVDVVLEAFGDDAAVLIRGTGDGVVAAFVISPSRPRI